MNKMFISLFVFIGIIGFVGLGCAGDPRGKEDDRAAAAAAGGAGGQGGSNCDDCDKSSCYKKYVGDECDAKEVCDDRCDGELVCIGGEWTDVEDAEGKCPTASTSTSSGSTSSSSGSSSSGSSSGGSSSTSTSSSGGSGGKWQVKYVPDGSVVSVEHVNVHAGPVFGWQELTSCSSDKTLCDLTPGNPQGELQVSADVKLSGGVNGSSCTANKSCEYYVRGKIYLIDPDGKETLLNATYNDYSASHCFACNATQRSEKFCNVAKANCVP